MIAVGEATGGGSRIKRSPTLDHQTERFERSVEFLAAATMCGGHCSRLAADLCLWSGPEFDFVELPDDPQVVADALENLGFGVEEMRPLEATFSGVVVGKVLEVGPHPNADKIRLTGNKWNDKMYHHHSGYIGGIHSANARITRIEKSRAEKLPGVAVVLTGQDLARMPGVDPHFGPAFRDQPILCVDKACYVGDPVVAVAAAVEKLHPDVNFVSEIGGEDMKTLFLTRTGRAHNRQVFMQSACSGGTGAFIEKIAGKLNLSPKALARMRYLGLPLHRISSK